MRQDLRRRLRKVNPNAEDDLLDYIEGNASRSFKEETDAEAKEENGETAKGSDISYRCVINDKVTAEDEVFKNVIGHENQKKELISVVKWFKDSAKLKEKGVSIPKGVVLFGEPGNGKSLMIKEIINFVDAPVFVFEGGDNDVTAGIVETFKKARETGHSVIVIDELDLLINKDRRVVRALQENLDGVESTDDILVLAATNNIHDIPDALLRNGRLEKIVRIPYPTGKEAVKLLKKFMADFNLKTPEDFDEDELSITLTRVTCAGIKSIVNDLVLRNGFENITSDMIYKSIFNITDRVKDATSEDNIEVAIHEASHALVASLFKEHFALNRLNISGASGEFNVKEVKRGIWPYDKVMAHICISMAGVIGEKALCHTGGRGCEEDLDKARSSAYNIINRCGYSSCWETLPGLSEYNRRESQKKLRHNEVKIERLLRRCEAKTKRLVKANKAKITALANLLYEKKHLKSSDIHAILD